VNPKYLKTLAVYDTPLRARYDAHGHAVVNEAMRLVQAQTFRWTSPLRGDRWLQRISLDEAIVYVRRGVTADDAELLDAMHALA
jgi:hypothetical protein